MIKGDVEKYNHSSSYFQPFVFHLSHFAHHKFVDCQVVGFFKVRRNLCLRGMLKNIVIAHRFT